MLLHSPNFDGKGNDLSIHVRTTIRYDYSYIESAAIRIGRDVLEVGSFADYALNGVDTPDLDNQALSGYHIQHTLINKKKHTFDIVLGPNNEKITIGTFKDLVSVSIHAGAESAKNFGNSVGMMGSYNGTLLSRDGKTAMDDVTAFGQEWQVNQEGPKLFRVARAPQYPVECILPSASAVSQRQRRLGETLARQAAEKACARAKQSRFDNCVFDVMAIGDVEIAGSYGA